jgi:hypothetical protein
MADPGPHGVDVEGAIIDADLLVKYRLVNRAIETLQEAMRAAPRSIPLREKLREIFIDNGKMSDAAQLCMDLSALYIAAEKLEAANERLLEAKRLDPRVSITARLNQLSVGKSAVVPGVQAPETVKSITGDLSDISIFDIVQILENSRMTGILALRGTSIAGKIYFNDGLVVDAEIGTRIGMDAFGDLVELTEGQFEFGKAQVRFQQRIQSTSNTSLILDVLRHKDEQRAGVEGSEDELVL